MRRLALLALLGGAFLITYGVFIEPGWIAVVDVDLGGAAARYRVVHFSDLHYKGNRKLLAKAVDTVNSLSPDIACFTGDIVEDAAYLDEALGELRRVQCPLYGVPGNHEYWSGAPFEKIARAFESTGGAWLVDEAVCHDGSLAVVGLSGLGGTHIPEVGGARRILLVHYPEFVKTLKGKPFDLILAGHTHGGQINIPFWGPLITPPGTGMYKRGLYCTPSGPLYVNPGMGTFGIPARLFCRPEVTLISID